MISERKFLIFFFIILAAGGIIYFIMNRKIDNRDIQKAVKQQETGTFVKIGGKKIRVEIANNIEDISRGLSGRNSLDPYSGMLFDFSNSPGIKEFWMKDMIIPIDIVWINSGKVVYIHQDLQPEPGVSEIYLKRYSSLVSVDYVLEVNAGYVEKNGFKVGDEVEIFVIK